MFIIHLCTFSWVWFSMLWCKCDINTYKKKTYICIIDFNALIVDGVNQPIVCHTKTLSSTAQFPTASCYQKSMVVGWWVLSFELLHRPGMCSQGGHPSNGCLGVAVMCIIRPSRELLLQCQLCYCQLFTPVHACYCLLAKNAPQGSSLLTTCCSFSKLFYHWGHATAFPRRFLRPSNWLSFSLTRGQDIVMMPVFLIKRLLWGESQFLRKKKDPFSRCDVL